MHHKQKNNFQMFEKVYKSLQHYILNEEVSKSMLH